VLTVNYSQTSPGMLERLNQLVREVSTELTLADSPIDEVSVLDTRSSGDTASRLAFTKHMVGQPGVELFNTARDEVQCFPIPARYSVDYDFYRTPYSWRLEVMRFNESTGVSPLHRTYLPTTRRQGSDMHVVHLSFKCIDEDEYEKCLLLLASDGYACAQQCESTYGRFSYWTTIEKTGPLRKHGVWLKPRVNLQAQRKAAVDRSLATLRGYEL
jgi:hypothetical protein